MYNEEEAARPYSRALVHAAMTLDAMARVRGDMETLDAQWRECEALREWCTAFHSVPRAEHQAFVDEVWGETLSQPVRILLVSLSEAGLLAALPQVIRVFRRLADRAEGRKDVTFVFAVEPAPKTLEALTAKALAAYGPQTKVQVQVDARLAAGVIIRAGNTQVDGSLAGRLRRLRTAFAQNKDCQ